MPNVCPMSHMSAQYPQFLPNVPNVYPMSTISAQCCLQSNLGFLPICFFFKLMLSWKCLSLKLFLLLEVSRVIFKAKYESQILHKNQSIFIMFEMFVDQTGWFQSRVWVASNFRVKFSKPVTPNLYSANTLAHKILKYIFRTNSEFNNF